MPNVKELKELDPKDRLTVQIESHKPSCQMCFYRGLCQYLRMPPCMESLTTR